MSFHGKKTQAIFQKAKQYIPHGVNSNFRYLGDDDAFIITRGEGAYIWDADGNRYIDYRLGFGPIILGHAYPAVVKRVQEAIEGGTVFAWTTPLEVQVAERIARLCKVDKVRLANSGTEATMHALRIARAYTGREKFIKFEGQYHGMADYFMFSTASSPARALGSRRSPIPAPVTSGIPRAIQEYVISLPFNDLEAVERTLKARWGEMAAVFVEPMMGNAAGIMPRPGFLEGLRALCDEYGVVLVMDEVKTGFRIGNAGAQGYFGVKADLVTYAKALGNGFPIAAIAGKEEVMMTVEPGAVAHGGTYTGNVVATAAADATLEILENEPVIETIFRRGETLMTGIAEILSEAGIPHVITGLPSMFGLLLGTEETPTEFRHYLEGDAHLYEQIMQALYRYGVMPDLEGLEPWFLCYSLSEADVAETLEKFNQAVQEAKN